MAAVVIPFPKVPPTPPTAAVDQGSQERLDRALSNLRAALADQRQALGDWRFAMSELSIGVTDLGFTLEAYRQSLDEVQAKLGGLQIEGARLAAWAADAG